MAIKKAISAAVLLVALLGWAPVAQAEAATVDAHLLCQIKAAIRWRDRAWSPAECERIATALNETTTPPQFLAMAINESDLRERAQRITVLADGRLARDLGLLAVRCVTDPEAQERDRCTNGAARGLYAHQLLDPGINVRTAQAVLSSHQGRLDGFNGCVETKRRRCTYAKRIRAIEAALGGRLVPVKDKRTAKLCRLVVEAVTGERRS